MASFNALNITLDDSFSAFSYRITFLAVLSAFSSLVYINIPF